MSFHVPEHWEALSRRLTTTAPAGYAAKLTVDGIRVAPSPVLLHDGTEALLTLVPEGDGTRVEGVVRLTRWSRFMTYGVWLAVLVFVVGVVTAVAERDDVWDWLRAVYYAVVAAVVVSSVARSRTALRRLRGVVRDLVAG